MDDQLPSHGARQLMTTPHWPKHFCLRSLAPKPAGQAVSHPMGPGWALQTPVPGRADMSDCLTNPPAESKMTEGRWARIWRQCSDLILGDGRAAGNKLHIWLRLTSSCPVPIPFQGFYRPMNSQSDFIYSYLRRWLWQETGMSWLLQKEYRTDGFRLDLVSGRGRKVASP